MCIIIVKPSGCPAPTEEVMTRCWGKNPDGAGMMWNDGKIVHYSKGYMKLQTFLSHVKQLDIKHDWCLHFRITTHGGTNQQCTHPFPYTTDIDAMKRLDGNTDVAVMHNGIFPLAGGKDYSDTMEWVQLMAACKINPFSDDTHITKLIELSAEGQRVTFMNKSSVVLYGNWVKSGELYYSNNGFEAPTYNSWDRWYYDNRGNTQDIGDKRKGSKTYYKYKLTCDLCGVSCDDVDYYDSVDSELCSDCAEFYRVWDVDDKTEETEVSSVVVV
jgi:hypothetical protein